MSPIQIAEAFDIIALILAIILLLVCMLEFRYMDETEDTTPTPIPAGKPPENGHTSE